MFGLLRAEGLFQITHHMGSRYEANMGRNRWFFLSNNPLKNHILLPLFASSLLPRWCVIWNSHSDLSRTTVASTKNILVSRVSPIIHGPRHRVFGQKEELHPFRPTILRLFLHYLHQIYHLIVFKGFNMVSIIPNSMSRFHPYSYIFHAITSLLGHG